MLTDFCQLLEEIDEGLMRLEMIAPIEWYRIESNKKQARLVGLY